jgi:hypothetical protein
MRKGEHVRWYVMSGLNDFDFHTPHWHGNTVLIGGMRTDVTSVAPHANAGCRHGAGQRGRLVVCVLSVGVRDLS